MGAVLDIREATTTKMLGSMGRIQSHTFRRTDLPMGGGFDRLSCNSPTCTMEDNLKNYWNISWHTHIHFLPDQLYIETTGSGVVEIERTDLFY
jgi:hypothetical protein